MLINFRVENFRSYKEEQVFSMVASVDDKLRENTFQSTSISSLHLNRSAFVCGANASGKSTLIQAIIFAQLFVKNSADRSQKANQSLQAFSLDEMTRNAPSEFELLFVYEDIRYQYGFSVDSERVHEEWLIAYPKGKAQTWFERTASDETPGEHDWYFGPSLKGAKGRLVELTRPDSLFVSVAANFAHKQLSKVYEWFTQNVYTIGDSLPLHLQINHTVSQIEENPEFFDQTKALLRHADLGISDFSFETEGGNLNIEFEHYSDEKRLSSTRLALRQESLGTQKLLGAAGFILSVLKHGAVLFMDEIDSSLHPLLVEEIVRMFHNPKTNPNNAQLIFNTHDLTLLDLTLFRRDQIWFTEKDRNGATTLYSLLEYKPRNDEAISKGYLQGRYGAVPFIDPYTELFINGS